MLIAFEDFVHVYWSSIMEVVIFFGGIDIRVWPSQRQSTRFPNRHYKSLHPLIIDMAVWGLLHTSDIFYTNEDRLNQNKGSVVNLNL